MKTIKYEEVKHLFESEDESAVNHPKHTCWVSPDKKQKTFSFNNNGPVGWLKVVK